MDRTTTECWMRRGLVLLGALLALAGCNQRDIGPITPHTNRAFRAIVGQDGTPHVDLLFVVDDSGSMTREQDNLEREIPALVRALAEPPLDASGNPRWNAVETLNIAVVTTNMGTSGVPQDSRRVGARCTINDFQGEGGEFRSDGTANVFSFHAGDDPDAFAARVGAVAQVGDGGCGLEQPLGAAMKALDHDAGFPREDSLLAVVVLSDEEDCTLADPVEFFSGTETGLALNQRCSRRPELLENLDGILASLRGDRNEQRFVFAALVGMPESLSAGEPATILAHPEMAYRYTDENATGLVPACNSANGAAAPGRRYVELASRIEGALVSSICAESFEPAITELAARIGGRVDAVCATRSLTPDADGAVNCEVLETLPVGFSCGEFTGRQSHSFTDEGREVCRVQQAVRGETSGWRYEVGDGECEAVVFTEDALPEIGAVISLECLVDVEVPATEEPTG